MKHKKLLIATALLVIVAGALGVMALGLYRGNRKSDTTYVSAEELVEMTPEQADQVQVQAQAQPQTQTEDKEGGSFLSDLFDLDVMKGRDVSNILLIGQDAREGEEQQRSDAMIVASLNTKKKEITLVSLMRDMYVEIPGYGKNRINAAFAYGGPSLLLKTIEQNFGLDVDHYMEVDLEGFIRTMASVGSLEVELSQEEADYLNANDSYGTTDNSVSTGTRWNLHAGVNELDPEQALAYARIRYVGNSDYERTERQRKVLMAAFHKLKDVNLFSLIGVVNSVMSSVETDMGVGQTLGYCYIVLTDNLSIGSTTRIPADGAYSSQMIDGMDVLVPDLAANSAILQSVLYGNEAS